MQSPNLTTIQSWQRWLITAAVMLAAVMEVLDMTIVNVALPHMMGSLGANTEQITWVLTSYIVAAAVVMPLTGLLVSRFGRKKLLLVCMSCFLISSVLCGAATSLTSIVLFRTAQGLFGASLVPLSQFILRDTFPVEQQGKAMAIWGIGIMAGPVLGPTLGGYITETLNWRWVFYINVPVCIVALPMTWFFITETPTTKKPMDKVGLFLLVLGIGSLQLMLDQGNNNDWFQSSFIVMLALMAVCSLVTFTRRGIKTQDNIINLRLFYDKNFAVATLLVTLFSMGLFAIIAILPILLEELMQYPAVTTGLVMAPQGIASAIGMVIVARYTNRIDARWFILIGGLLSSLGAYAMSHFNLAEPQANIMLACAINGLGMGLFFVPLATACFTTLPAKDAAEASGLFSFGRSLGSSMGISLISTLLSRETQINWHRLSGHLSLANENFHAWLQSQQGVLTNAQSLQYLGNILEQQASSVAFIDCFHLIALSFLGMLPLLFLLQKAKQTAPTTIH